MTVTAEPPVVEPVGRSAPHRPTVPGAPAPRRPVLQLAFLPIGLLAAWVLLYAFVLSGLQERSSQARLYQRTRSDLAAVTLPTGPPIAPGAPVAVLSIPEAGVTNEVVVEGTTSQDLALGPGHLPSTPLPGQAGVSVVMARSVTFGGPFGGITSLRARDRFRVTTQTGTYTYQVIDVRRPGAPLPDPPTADQSRVTLVTSAASGWRSGWAPSHAVYVDALAIAGKVVAAPAVLPPTLVSSSPMRADTNALMPLLLWLEALVVAAVGAAWAWVRWGRWQTWLVGVPIIVGALWAATGQAFLLLPNLV